MSKKSEQPVNRKIKGEIDVHHDLFRLENAITKKNISYTAQPLWEPVEHKHFYHSVDSDGKPQDKSCPTASHFHYIEVKEVNGELVASCSKPHTFKTIKGKKQIVEYHDDHTHSVTYLQSEIVKQRVFNEDALKTINKMQAEHTNRMKNPL